MVSYAGEEVNILGGGISGLACAIILRKNGYAVNVYERRHSVGARFRNDWQVIENWSEKNDVLRQIGSDGIEPSFEYEPLCELNLHYSGKTRLLQGKNVSYIVKRGNSKDSLDVNLLEQATVSGVNVHFGSDPGKDIPMHIDATGPETPHVLARGITFTTDHENEYHMALGDRIAKGFYSYLVIKDGHGTMVTVFDRKYSRLSEAFLMNTGKCFAEYVNEKDLESGRKFGGYGNFEVGRKLYNENGAMRIGEAAGFQDFLFGFGMRYAFQSASLAARSIMHEHPYEELVKDNLLQKLKHSKRNRFIFETMGTLAYPFTYYLLGANKDIRKLLYMIYR
ncbi:MAG: NAD(P)/FAD-dependent oxidoreductase [Methanolobus sp.]|nr:NAD(P)/FAD-dependent oxidoreductase [Methanolobus sp.]